MKTLLTAAIAGVILFAASASVSWYLMNQNIEPVETEVADLDPAAEVGVPPIGDGVDKQEQMPVALRPNVPITVEAVLELSDSIRKKERELIEREKQVKKAEDNIKLLFEDLKIERDQLTALAQRIESKLQQADGRVAELRIENEELSTKSQQLSQMLQNKKGKGEEELDEIEERVKKAKPWFDGLESEQAASYLKTFANEGELEFAAKLLDSMDKRDVAEILQILNDPIFVDQILKTLSEKKPDLRNSRLRNNIR